MVSTGAKPYSLPTVTTSGGLLSSTPRPTPHALPLSKQVFNSNANQASQVQRTVLGLVGAASLAAAVPAIDVQGSFFVNNATGARYQIVGVAYQPGGSAGYNPGSGVDPLSNKDECLRDAALMQILGVNAIRVYNIDPNVNHDECASIFNAVCPDTGLTFIVARA